MTPPSLDPPAPIPPLQAYLAGLLVLDALHRRKRGKSREFNQIEKRQCDFWELLTVKERIAADAENDRLRRLRDGDREDEAAQMDNGRPRRKSDPKTTLPGSESRIKEYAACARFGVELHSDGDLDEDAQRGLLAARSRNGAGGTRGQGHGVQDGGPGSARETPCQAVGRRIREARQRKGWKQSQLARKIGAHQPTLSRIERGDYYPSMAILRELVDKLGVSSDELLGFRR